MSLITDSSVALATDTQIATLSALPTVILPSSQLSSVSSSFYTDLSQVTDLSTWRQDSSSTEISTPANSTATSVSYERQTSGAMPNGHKDIKGVSWKTMALVPLILLLPALLWIPVMALGRPLKSNIYATQPVVIGFTHRHQPTHNIGLTLYSEMIPKTKHCIDYKATMK